MTSRLLYHDIMSGSQSWWPLFQKNPCRVPPYQQLHNKILKKVLKRQKPLSPPSPPSVSGGRPADRGFQSPSLQHRGEAPSPGCWRPGDLFDLENSEDDLDADDDNLDPDLDGMFAMRAFAQEPFLASCAMLTSDQAAQEKFMIIPNWWNIEWKNVWSIITSGSGFETKSLSTIIFTSFSFTAACSMQHLIRIKIYFSSSSFFIFQPACFGAGCYIKMATSYH